MHVTNGTNEEMYSRLSPSPCWQLRIISVYCFVLFTSSGVVNGSILWVFLKCKDLRTPVNMFVIVFTLLSFIATFFEGPFVVASNMSCRWVWGKLGFVMYFVGCTQIYLMAAISFERFIIIYKPFTIKMIDFKGTYIGIAFCSLMGLIWAGAPLFGWSYYSLEGALTSCSVEWYERTPNVISYNMAIFITTFVVPVAVILTTNLRLLFIVKSMPKFASDSKDDAKAKKRADNERQLTIVMMVYILGFVVSWFPYALVCLYAAFIGNDLSPMSGTLPAMFAKSSFLWSSLIYVYSNKQVREKLNLIRGEKVEKPEASMSRENATVKQTNV